MSAEPSTSVSENELSSLLSRSEARFRALIVESVDGMIVLDPNGSMIYANPAAEDLLAARRDELIGTPLGLPLVTGDRTEIDMRRGDGSHVVVELRAFPSEWDGSPATLVWLRDLTAQVELQRSLAAANERYELVAAGTRDGLWDWDLVRGEVFYSARSNELLGREATATAGPPSDWFDRVHEEDREILHEAIDTHLAGRRDRVECEFRVQRGSEERWLHVRGVTGDVGGTKHLAGSLTDVTARRKAEDLMRYRALHDTLTGLANRALLTQELRRRVSLLRRHPETGLGVIFTDIVGFKGVNDDHGHDVGDNLLRSIADRLKTCVRPEDLVARLGGDEFVAVIDAASRPEAFAIAERIRKSLCQPFDVDDLELQVGASVGMRFCTDFSADPSALLRSADAAMYRAKRSGSSTSVDYERLVGESEGPQSGVDELLALGQLEVHYLTMASIDDGRVVGVEAFVRWRHPETGLLPAPVVLDLTNKIQIPKLDQWVMRTACVDSQSWTRKGLELPAGVTVNVVRADLESKEYVRSLIALVGMPGAPIFGIDVDESELRAGGDELEEALDLLRSHGVTLHIDNYGSGATSLALLNQLRPSMVKIDVSLTGRLDVDPASVSLARSIVAGAREVGATVVAEGVERPEQLTVLRELGCDFGQGSLFGRVSTADELLAEIAPPGPSAA